MKGTKISCPGCGFEIDIEEALTKQFESKYSQEYKNKIEQETQKLKQKQELLDKQQDEYANKVDEEVKNTLKKERKEIEEKLKKSIEEEQSETLKLMQEELAEKSEKIKDFNKMKALLEQEKREKNELREQIEAETQKEMNEKLALEQEKIRKSVEEKNELKFMEMQKKLEDQKKLVDEMKRKQEQGSMQLQGEVQELAIEQWLKTNFPLDTVDEVKKGARGADCLQTVNTREKQNCGNIYYESKRTKDFSNAWIEKFKTDMRDKNANIGVLITDAYPKDMERMGLKDGIWICSYEEFKGLCFALRESLIQINNIVMAQENKGDKMEMLYSYLTGNEFRNQVEAIVEGFVQMKGDLESEKRAMNSIWKKREKQIDKVLMNTTNMHASVKGIAGNAIQTIKSLELPDDLQEIEEE